jgi:hypothetical protein
MQVNWHEDIILAMEKHNFTKDKSLSAKWLVSKIKEDMDSDPDLYPGIIAFDDDEVNVIGPKIGGSKESEEKYISYKTLLTRVNRIRSGRG